MNSRNRQADLWIAAILIVVCAIGGCNGEAKPLETDAPKAETVALEGDWVEVQRRTLASTISAIGTLRARQVTRLGTQVSGRVEEVLVDVGERVTKGHPLVRIDPVLFSLELDQAKAELNAAQTAREDAALNYERMRNLWEKPEGGQPSIPRKLYDDAKARFDAAQARLAQAESLVEYAKQRLNETVIRAPYDGVITGRMVDPGEPVTSTPISHLMEIQDISSLELDFAMPQEMLSRIRPGVAVRFDAEGVDGGPASGSIEVVFPDIDEATRSFRCRVIVPNSGGRYRPGLLVHVLVEEAKRENVLTVPRNALHRGVSGWEVVSDVGGVSTTKPVGVGILTEDYAEITSGLDEGVRVLVGTKG